MEKSKSQRVQRETASFLKAVPVMHFDEEAASRSAALRANLEKKGLGIGPYDTLIAGHSLALKRTLFTGNIREFERVPKLPLLELVRLPL